MPSAGPHKSIKSLRLSLNRSVPENKLFNSNQAVHNELWLNSNHYARAHDYFKYSKIAHLLTSVIHKKGCIGSEPIVSEPLPCLVHTS